MTSQPAGLVLNLSILAGSQISSSEIKTEGRYSKWHCSVHCPPLTASQATLHWFSFPTAIKPVSFKSVKKRWSKWSWLENYFPELNCLSKLHQEEQLATVFHIAMLAWHTPECAWPQSQMDSRGCACTPDTSQKYPKCSEDTWRQATYSTTRVGAPIEERTGNPHYFRFHLPQTREYIWMERITPGKLFIHLQKTKTES